LTINDLQSIQDENPTRIVQFALLSNARCAKFSEIEAVIGCKSKCRPLTVVREIHGAFVYEEAKFPGKNHDKFLAAAQD